MLVDEHTDKSNVWLMQDDLPVASRLSRTPLAQVERTCLRTHRHSPHRRPSPSAASLMQGSIPRQVVMIVLAMVHLGHSQGRARATGPSFGGLSADDRLPPHRWSRRGRQRHLQVLNRRFRPYSAMRLVIGRTVVVSSLQLVEAQAELKTHGRPRPERLPISRSMSVPETAWRVSITRLTRS
jgi:hypothetical protein